MVYVWIDTKDVNIIHEQRMNDKVIEWNDTFFKYQIEHIMCKFNSEMSMRFNLSTLPLPLYWIDNFDVGVMRM